MWRWGTVAITILIACKAKEGNDKPAPALEPKPAPSSSVDAAAPVVDAAVAGPPTPKAKRGFIVFVTKKAKSGEPITTSPVQLVDPDGGQPIATPIADGDNTRVGTHVITSFGNAGSWTLDLRKPTMVAATSERIEFLTPDDRVVWRCSGGIDRPFEICISDADGGNKKVVLKEPYDPPNLGVIGAAGRDVIHANYTILGKKPWFSIAIADGKRTEYPDLLRRAKSDDDVTFEPFYSPNGTKAVSVKNDLLVTTFDGSVKPQTFAAPGKKKPTRAECRFSNDDAFMACALLPTASESGNDELVLYDLKANKVSTLAKDIAIGEFVFSPDGTELAYITLVDKKWVLRTTTRDGKTQRDHFEIDGSEHLLEVVGWTAPN